MWERGGCVLIKNGIGHGNFAGPPGKEALRSHFLNHSTNRKATQPPRFRSHDPSDRWEAADSITTELALTGAGVSRQTTLLWLDALTKCL